ncbi:MAG TPA: sigma 54-interacting transcriptional regulator, partial [Bacteroidota bacterium]|nr:sigma 54-interacting transcriptional regulator [Bacteroidota bacterium]
MEHVLIVDTQQDYWTDLTHQSPQSEVQIHTFPLWKEAQQSIQHIRFFLIILNAGTSDAHAIELTWKLKQQADAPEIIIITDRPNADEAEQAIRSGAWEYILRPSKASELIPLIKRIAVYSNNRLAAHQTDETPGAMFEGIAGDSPQIKSCLAFASQAAQSDAHVLIRGETGTGKELLAWAIHKNSPRANNNFVVVDCAALPETLVESTLFGHERGAFTGADKVQDGLIKQADGGTLFLDEVGELSPSIQKSFLRVLEEHAYRRVGGKEELTSDFRLLSATNKDLDQGVQHGTFREDLLFRLRSFMIELPPLRDRKEDIRYIIQHHLPRLCSRVG